MANNRQESVRAIRRAKGGMVSICSRSSDSDLWCHTAARKRVTRGEAGDVLQVVLHHFAACSALLHTPSRSDVRSYKCSADNIGFILNVTQGFQAEMENRTEHKLMRKTLCVVELIEFFYLFKMW